MNAVQRQTLLNLTENLFEAIDKLDPGIIATREPASVRVEFDKLRETIDRYLPPDTAPEPVSDSEVRAGSRRPEAE